MIKDAKSATYTPVADDDDAACLRVKVSYLDGFYDVGDSRRRRHDVRQERLAMVLDGKVQQAAENTPPKFASARMMRYVPEDARGHGGRRGGRECRGPGHGQGR